MNLRKLSAAASTAAALVALAYAPVGHAEPRVDPAPPCLAQGTCMLLTPNAASRYLPLTPASNAYAPAGTAQ